MPNPVVLGLNGVIASLYRVYLASEKMCFIHKQATLIFMMILVVHKNVCTKSNSSILATLVNGQFFNICPIISLLRQFQFWQ